jgi:hypothetical protein
MITKPFTSKIFKKKKKKKKTWLKPVYLFSQIALCSKSGDQPQENLAKSGYKLRKFRNLIAFWPTTRTY